MNDHLPEHEYTYKTKIMDHFDYGMNFIKYGSIDNYDRIEKSFEEQEDKMNRNFKKFYLFNMSCIFYIPISIFIFYYLDEFFYLVDATRNQRIIITVFLVWFFITSFQISIIYIYHAIYLKSLLRTKKYDLFLVLMFSLYYNTKYDKLFYRIKKKVIEDSGNY